MLSRLIDIWSYYLSNQITGLYNKYKKKLKSFFYNTQKGILMAANLDKTIEQLNTEKLQIEITRLIAETTKLNKESEKITKELKWYEVTIIVAATLAIVAITKLAL